MSSHSNLVQVAIVNYRTPELTIDCLQSLVSEIGSLPGTKVVVVDNNSGDNSVEKIEEAITANGWQNWASVLASDYNGGYAYGNNLVIRSALTSANPPDYFMILNPDTQVRAGALKMLVDFLEEHPHAGIAGACVEGENGYAYQIAFRFPSILGEFERGLRLGIVSKLLSKWVVAQEMRDDEPTEVDWVSGGTMMIRRQVFESAGLMDEDYFLYYEETDFCLQAKRAGWSSWHIPYSRIMHIGGQSSGITAPGTPKRLPQYWFNSRRRYFLKNYGLLYSILADAAWLSGYTLWRLRRLIQSKPDSDPPYLLIDSFSNSVFLKGGTL
ncbi:glycosyltransferase family 2 protein [Gloeothece verrucosa]|uniref:Glycosyl transferase family 2 n=1 Tax=Gloeothece verrucosa (strain PCC 7822) TaxID=497965 RepID=E0UL39_GLOV7|nr:glycosyltransferase family 2 protein [Gloeothece verrucosa]ADN17669.1 glycosyl transferase family 2 [Gloeothece verrucosa PCC 7822]